MEPFPKTNNFEYILVAIDYVSKWVEAMPYNSANSKYPMKIFTEVIFPCFGVSRQVINEGGSHFVDTQFRNFLTSLGIQHHVATPYHPQKSGQVETSNKQIKNILQNTVEEMGKSWHVKLYDALWTYRIAFSLTPYWYFIIKIFTDYKESAKTKSHETKKETKKMKKNYIKFCSHK